MSIPRILGILAQVIVIAMIAGVGAVRYVTVAPETGFDPAHAIVHDGEKLLRAKLEAHARALASVHAHNDGLDRAADHIRKTLEGHGFKIGTQSYTAGGKTLNNLDAVIEPANAGANPDVIVIGAHYDSADGSPGANDNATGVAATLELAGRLRDLAGTTRKRIRFVFFASQAPPALKTMDMGSMHYARMLAARKERVVGMYSLDSLGYYSDEPGTQRHAGFLDLLLPDRGDFVAIVGSLSSYRLARASIRAFRAHTVFPSFMGIGFESVPGTSESDHWSFAQQDFPAVWITDTAGMRDPQSGKPGDTPDRIDFDRLTRVVRGIEHIVRDAAR